MKWLVRLYPRAWRRQYEKEFARLLEEYDLSFKIMLDVVLGACDAHYQQWRSATHFWRNTFIITAGGILGALGFLALTEISPTLHTLPQGLALLIPIFSLLGMLLHLFVAIAGLKLLQEVRDNL